MKYLNLQKLLFLLAVLVLSCSSYLHSGTYIKGHEGAFDADWISNTGEVNAITSEYFALDINNINILVKMPNWDQFKNMKYINIGDRVTVSGPLDNSFNERNTITAFRVFSHSRDSYYYADSNNEEGYFHAYDAHVTFSIPDGTWFILSGNVSSLNGREFTLDTGQYTVIIDTDEMGYNPMDDKNTKKVKIGDHLRITGHLDVDLFEKNEIKSVIIEKVLNGDK